ncbi:hypothetical protein KGQ31_00290 [Patescibacteria group bacterium]|nr:hypothetical protein [Patescibacteria group bacterium]
MLAARKKIALIALGIVVVGGVVYFIWKGSQKTSYSAVGTQFTTAAQSAILEKDSDNDGLKDWEEELWKTDPYNPDTAGDGMPDGMKVKQGRDPLRPGPNNFLASSTVAAKINTTTESDLSETDKFSRELFIKIIADKNNNTPPTQEDLNNFLNNAIRQETQDQKAKKFTAGDFQADTSETPDKIRAYGNALAVIFTTKPATPLEYEMNVVGQAVNNNDPDELNKLDPLIAEYQLLEKKLLALTVPQSALPFHIALTNSVAGMIWSITGLKYVMTDPIRAYPGVAVYADNAQSFADSINKFRGYFISQNTPFEPNDPAYNFFQLNRT